MKIRKILSAVTAAAMALTLTACNGDTTPQNPLDIINSGITSSSANSSGSSENTSSSTSTTPEPQIDVDFIPEAPRAFGLFCFKIAMKNVVEKRINSRKTQTIFPTPENLSEITI